MQKVSVIIPNYNYGRFLRQAIQSALNQTLEPHEIIVVDDGSTDDSKEILLSFGDSIILVEQENAGVAAARNRGSEIATGGFLAFLDADDYWHPDKLEKQMHKFSSDAEIGFVHCGSTYVDENGKRNHDYITGEEGWVADELLRFEAVVIANTLVIKRELFAQIGGFDTTRELHPSEDWDICYRLSRLCKLGFVREPLLYYRQHGAGGHTNIARMEQAMLLAFDKAFRDPSAEIQELRREAYGNLYLTLAGSYYHAGSIGQSIRSGLKGFTHHPKTAGNFFAFRFRKVKALLLK
jgi:glycosyltransferase involved in cell wall biosynthesis